MRDCIIYANIILQPDTAIDPAGAPSSEEVAAQSAGMAGVLGGATKGIAGWAVSSIQSRVSIKRV